MNKILLLFLMTFLVSCGASKPKIATKKVAQISLRGISNKPVVKLENKEFKNGFPSNSKIEILEATQKIKVTQEMVLNYISNFKNIAKENMVSKGIPASITLAQGILESGAGTGNLARQANNHFGIKCHKEWTGESVKHDDDSAQECFRKYTQPEQSYRDHCAFLTSRSWYSPLFLLPKNDYKSWANGLKKSGYATDVKYPQKLIGIIERYQLQQYDAEVLGLESLVASLTPGVTAAEPISSNNAEKYIVAKGDTLYSISKKFNLTIEDLKRKNNLSENGLALGQTLNVK